ncbi:hypothetical protein NH8B_2502 [Pseudogulbenkiania sp. NH8B]|nr:hypothetical protein NH8B_2502 [Pseudogulbenkiania sp. NH8B]
MNTLVFGHGAPGEGVMLLSLGPEGRQMRARVLRFSAQAGLERVQSAQLAPRWPARARVCASAASRTATLAAPYCW